jgi:hypothetical protein
MKIFGILLMLIGVAVGLFSFLADVSVAIGSGSGDVINIGLLQQQMMLFELGLSGFVSGTILFAGGSVVEAFHSQQHDPSNSVDRSTVAIGFDPKDHI